MPTYGITPDPNDPYAGEENASFFLGRWIAKFTGDPDGFLSNYKEWHILWEGVAAGFHSKTLADFPKCPDMWKEDSAYYEVPAAITNLIKCQWPTISLIATYYGAKIFGILG